MANEYSQNIPMIWKDDYLFESGVTFLQIVEAFVKNVPGIAAMDIGNCLDHLMIFCRSGCPADLEKATQYLNHANSFYYGINPNWNAKKGEGNEN